MNPARRCVIVSGAALGLAAALGGLPARAADDESAAAAWVRKAEATVNAFAQNPDLGDFRQALAQAKAVLIFPQIVKAAELVGGSAGKGMLLVRDPETGAWSGPVFFSMVSASLGLQVGASTTQTVLVVRTQKALQALYEGKVKLGSDASVSFSLWKKGVTGSASLDSAFVAYSTVQGVFMGVAMDGSVIDIDDPLNRAYYGEAVSPSQVLVEGKNRNPAAAGLRNALKRVAKLDL